jgi:hypothetical protein
VAAAITGIDDGERAEAWELAGRSCSSCWSYTWSARYGFKTAQTQDDDKSVKQDVRDAGHSTKEATKTTGRKVKKGTKKVVNKSATKTAETADKVAGKTKP